MKRRIFDWPLVNKSSRNKIKQIVSEPLHRFYIFQREGLRLRSSRLSGFFLFRDCSFTKGQPPISVTGHRRILSCVDHKFTNHTDKTRVEMIDCKVIEDFLTYSETIKGFISRSTNALFTASIGFVFCLIGSVTSLWTLISVGWTVGPS